MTIIFIVLSFMIPYIFIWRIASRNVTEKFTIWIVFSVIITLLPIGFNAIRIYLFNGDPSLEQLLENGELFIVAVAIGADAIGKLLTSNSNLIKNNSPLKIISVGLCLMLVVFASLLFATISSETPFTNAISLETSSMAANPERVSFVSMIMFLSTIIVSAVCIILSEV